MRREKGRLAGVGLVGAVLAMAAVPYAQSPASDGSTATPRGIYVEGSKLGISAEIEIDRNGTAGTVPTTFEFKSGDRFRLNLTVNRDSYVYVLNRTMKGDRAKSSRGIEVVAGEDAKSNAPQSDAYTLIFPTPNTPPQMIKAFKPTRLPGSAYFRMDEVTGAEKMLILASDKPLDISKYFNPSGKLQSSARNDTPGSVLNRLNAELLSAAGNAQAEHPPASRDIVIKPKPVAPRGSAPGGSSGQQPPPASQKPGTAAAVGVAKQAGKPMLLELTLVHLAR